MLAVLRWNCGEEQIIEVPDTAHVWEVGLGYPIIGCFKDGELLAGNAVFSVIVVFIWRGLEVRIPQNNQIARVFVVLGGEMPWMAPVLRRERLLRELDECEREIARGRKNAELRNAAEIGQG